MRASTIFASALALASSVLAAPATTPKEPRAILQSWPEPIKDQTSAIQKRFAGGWCGVHVHGHHKLDSSTRSGWINVLDANGYLVFQNDEIWQDQASIQIEAQEGGMPDKLYATIFPSGNPTSGDVFRYGDKSWRTGGANNEYFEGDLLVCKVGNWNSGAGLVPSYEEIDLDCGFSC
ncbi:hypothetical protein B0J13DRAFT_626708 [Dactylonectria estremocensis]|uniref:Uncharacterized protein n=1 Tax=Dactylonectria estremocensis TaxID=1079267 RepID=A0A9P9IUL2_9HYPO|nr:hypothetical protein B0J13DRAFT_626708 [Dactylonectria estremocensis]